jgi:hypothetical protein
MVAAIESRLVDNFIPTDVPGDRDFYRGGIDTEVHNAMTRRSGWNWARMRKPYIDHVGQRDQVCVTVNTGRYTTEKGERRAIAERWPVRDLHLRYPQLEIPIVTGLATNATTLRKEEWDFLEQTVLRAARYRLRFWADLASANSFGGFNAMAKSTLEWETVSDPGEALVDMDGLEEGRNDEPLFQLEGMPLPITHSDFFISARRLAESRNTGTPLDTLKGEFAGRRVAEKIEKTAIGVITGMTGRSDATQTGGYGRTPAVYGLINFPARLTYTTLNNPTSGGWTASKTLSDILSVRQQLLLNKFYGPYMLYHSNDWDNYLDNDYILTGGNVATQTLRERLKAIEGISDCRRLDFLFGSVPTTGAGSSSRGPGTEVDVTLKDHRFVLVQMTPDVCQAVNGMDITTVQWESVGGMRLNFKVMCIQAGRFRADYYGNCGLIDATNS